MVRLSLVVVELELAAGDAVTATLAHSSAVTVEL
jgi:hypothetical protein